MAAGVILAEHALIAAGSPAATLLPFAVLAAVVVAHTRDPAVTLACVGLVTVSWDRVSFRTAGMTLKPAYVAFALALAVDVLRHLLAEPPDRAPGRARVVRLAAGASLALLAVATLRGGYVVEGGRQLVVIVLGALVPAWVLFRLGRDPDRRAVLLSWALAGAALAAAVGIYQFAAAYLGLPTVFRYTGVGGTLGRTAGLSYEPAFFAMYLVSLLPLATAALVEPVDQRSIRTAPRLVFALLVVGVLLSNARAGYLALPLAIGLPLLSRSGRRLVKSRAVVTLGSTVVLFLLLSAIVRFDVVGFVADRFASIADTQEAASNAPRLLLYETDRRIAADHLALGIGPGALGYHLPAYGFPLPAGQDLARVVANNIWLQALLDCGVLGPVGVAVVLAALYRLARRCRDPHGRWLATGTLLVFVVGGSLTSNLWDAKYWALIGLALACDAGLRAPALPDRDRVGVGG